MSSGGLILGFKSSFPVDRARMIIMLNSTLDGRRVQMDRQLTSFDVGVEIRLGKTPNFDNRSRYLRSTSKVVSIGSSQWKMFVGEG